MSLSTLVTLIRYRYHLEATELNNVLNQLHLRSDEKAEECAKKHVMTVVTDIFPRMGLDVSSLVEKEEKEE